MTGEGDGISSATGPNHTSQPLDAIVDWALGPRRGGETLPVPSEQGPAWSQFPRICHFRQGLRSHLRWKF